MLARLIRCLARQRTDGLFAFQSSSLTTTPVATLDRPSTVRGQLGIDIQYAIETERTIPAARNHAVRLARGNYIAIIDDDEFPPPEWLLRMYEGIHTFGVDGALGPVVPFFDDGAPAWLVKSGLCELPCPDWNAVVLESDPHRQRAAEARRVRPARPLFDPRFRTGGSDQEFFRQAMARGCRFVAIEGAPVFEGVPPARWSHSYWIKRALVNGFNAKLRRRSAPPARRLGLVMKSLVGTIAYAAAIPFCAFLGQHRLVACLEKGSYHLSRTCASFGIELWNRRDF